MQWVYGFVVNTLGLPSVVGYVVLGLLVLLFFYDLYDIYKHRNRGQRALVWILIVILVPLGTLIYLLLGRSNLRQAAPVPQRPLATRTGPYVAPSSNKPKTTASVIGSVVAGIALVAGIVVLAIFVLVVVAYIQCMNDPKCM